MILYVCQNIHFIHIIQIGSFLSQIIDYKLFLSFLGRKLLIGMFLRIRGYECYWRGSIRQKVLVVSKFEL